MKSVFSFVFVSMYVFGCGGSKPVPPAAPSESCPPGHVWADGQCHDEGQGHDAEHHDHDGDGHHGDHEHGKCPPGHEKNGECAGEIEHVQSPEPTAAPAPPMGEFEDTKTEVKSQPEEDKSKPGKGKGRSKGKRSKKK